MRIGVDLRMAGEDYGIGRYSFELVQKIIALDRENEYFLFVRELGKFRKAGFEVYPNVKLVLANYRHYSIKEQLLFPKMLEKFNLDLVHFLNFNAPVRYKGAFVVTIHDMVHHKLPGNKPHRIFHRLAYHWVMRNAVANSKLIITVSNASKKEILKIYPIPEAKIKVIYEAAVPVPVTDSDVAEVRQIYAITKPYVIFVGVMERKKNVIALAKAFDILKDKYNLNIQMVLVGKADPHYPEVLEAVQRINYRKDLIITGVVTDKEKYALYKGAKAFVSASLYEGFGLPGLEAMGLGIPLVVSNTEVFNEVYDNGAIYFDPTKPEDIAQQIQLILGDDKYRQLIANNAYSRAQHFSWQQAAKQTIQSYNNLKL